MLFHSTVLYDGITIIVSEMKHPIFKKHIAKRLAAKSTTHLSLIISLFALFHLLHRTWHKIVQECS